VERARSFCRPFTCLGKKQITCLSSHRASQVTLTTSQTNLANARTTNRADPPSPLLCSYLPRAKQHGLSPYEATPPRLEPATSVQLLRVPSGRPVKVRLAPQCAAITALWPRKHAQTKKTSAGDGFPFCFATWPQNGKYMHLYKEGNMPDYNRGGRSANLACCSRRGKRALRVTERLSPIFWGWVKSVLEREVSPAARRG
jgi:hypothetical protein